MAFILRKPPPLEPKLSALPYQLDAYREIKNFPYTAIFHEQGLGKTKIGLDVALYWLEEDHVDTVFIITKKSLVENWYQEINKHTHISPRILSGNRGDNIRGLNNARY